jgi:hypothetical protein
VVQEAWSGHKFGSPGLRPDKNGKFIVFGLWRLLASGKSGKLTRKKRPVANVLFTLPSEG